MANIQFNYLYRDGGNYKNYGSVVFANPNDVSLAELTSLIQSQLIDQTWFYHYHWHLPDLHPQTFYPHTDPTWHEFVRDGKKSEVESLESKVNPKKVLCLLSKNHCSKKVFYPKIIAPPKITKSD